MKKVENIKLSTQEKPRFQGIFKLTTKLSTLSTSLMGILNLNLSL